MKIIKHGSEKQYYFICVHCGCEFTMTYPEIQKNLELSNPPLMAFCPECGKKVIGGFSTI